MFKCAVVLLCIQAARASEGCAEGSCSDDVSDAPSMLQLGSLGARGRRSPESGESIPYMGPEGARPGPLPGQPLTINEDGIKRHYYLPGANIINGGSTVEYTPPYRFYMMKTSTTDYSNKANFWMPNYIGKTFTVDINFTAGGPGCGCNLNFYLVSMPAATPGSEGDYYCDAQCFPGKGCCPEFDMNEGNKEVQQITNHACTGQGSYPGQPDWQCNKWGDPELKTNQGEFSPGGGHTINSDLPYTYSQRFDEGGKGGDFIFTTTMSQGGQNLVKTMGPGNAQLNSMMGSIKQGMAFVTGYWFDSAMNWMDGDECGSGAEHCNKNPAYISNWRLTTNGEPVPVPPRRRAGPPRRRAGPSPPRRRSGGGGKCCYGGPCTGCNSDPSNWCNQNAGNCGQCTGKWCSGSGPAPPPRRRGPPPPRRRGAQPAPTPGTPGVMCNPNMGQMCPGNIPCPACGSDACSCPSSRNPRRRSGPRRRGYNPRRRSTPGGGGVQCNPNSVPRQRCPGGYSCPASGQCPR